MLPRLHKHLFPKLTSQKSEYKEENLIHHSPKMTDQI